MILLLAEYGMFDLLADRQSMNRPLSAGAALRFLLSVAALILAYAWATLMAFRRSPRWSFRMGWLAVALPVLGLMLLNPFTQCAVTTLSK
ncbi:MAG: hypothetical protein IPL96_05605 [Holophagaceae bacterium]|nr:hypothetical protein [Holophagaceae bacterium]